MIELDKAISNQGLSDSIAMTMQIHDELVFEVKKDFIDQAEKLITETMEGVLELSPRPIENKVPITISVAHGSNWGAAKD
jgi:DNA polymerase-1